VSALGAAAGGGWAGVARSVDRGRAREWQLICSACWCCRVWSACGSCGLFSTCGPMIGQSADYQLGRCELILCSPLWSGGPLLPLPGVECADFDPVDAWYATCSILW